MLTVQRRTVYHLTVTGAYSGTFVIFTGCFEADRVTLFRNSTARGTLRGLTSDALLQFNQAGAAQFSVIPHVRQKGTR